MNFTPLLVMLLGVVTVRSSNRQTPYRQRMIEHQTDYLRGRHNDRRQISVAAAVFLPRHPDGSLNFDIIPQYAEYLSHNGVRELHITGTLGGGPILALPERKKVIDEWVRVGKKFGMRIIVQVGGAPYPVVIATAEYAQEAGADAIITLPELYYKPATIEELVQFIGDVGKAAPHLPVLYYHYPNRTGIDFPPSQIVKMAKARVPNFKGIQYDSPNLRPLPAILNELEHEDRLIFVAHGLGASAYMLGVTTFVSTEVNIWPQLAAEIVDSLKRSDISRARELVAKLNMGIDAMRAAGNYISAQKATMKIVTGLDVGSPGRPIPPITHSARNRLEHELRALGLA